MCALMVVESIMAILLLPAFAASDVKTSRKAPLLLQRAKRLRIVSNFPYFSGISLHDRPCFVTQLAQLMTTRAQIFFSVAGDWQKFLNLLNCLFEIRVFPFQYPHREVMVRAWKYPFLSSCLNISMSVDPNARYNQHFTIPTFHAMKKDIASRLAHKNRMSVLSVIHKNRLTC